MRSVGISLPEAIRETGKGGLAATQQDKRLRKGASHRVIKSIADDLSET